MNEMTGVWWPKSDFSRVPYAVFREQDIYDLEQAHIFRGPVWCYLALEAEIPNPGDYKTTFVGDTPVVVNRSEDGGLHAFVNRCAHKGTMLVRDLSGNAQSHTCIYHHWCYDLTGRLIGVPFERGMRGMAGMPDTFEKDDHGLQTLRVASYRGVIFGSFDWDVESLEDFLDEAILEQIDIVFSRPIEVLGYWRQTIPGNWKLYFENLMDSYHAGLLHQFQTTFRLSRSTSEGGTIMDKFRRHRVIYSIYESDDADETSEHYEGITAYNEGLSLEDPSIVRFRDEVGDRRAINLLTIFPSALIQRITNSLATRQIRPKGPDAFELYWTYFGYVDDDPDLRELRIKQTNLVGPSGLISMEDGEPGALIQRVLSKDSDAYSVIEMGGIGPIDKRHTNLFTEVPVRGFWRYYCHLMGFGVEGGLPWPPTA